MIKNLKKRLKNQKGLTLIELLAVIVILGVIAAIAIPSINNVIENSKKSAVRADALQIIGAAKIYKAENVNATTMDENTLSSYIEQSSFTEFDVVQTANGFEFSGTSVSPAPVIIFNNADVSEINGADKKATTIPAAAPAQAE